MLLEIRRRFSRSHSNVTPANFNPPLSRVPGQETGLLRRRPIRVGPIRPSGKRRQAAIKGMAFTNYGASLISMATPCRAPGKQVRSDQVWSGVAKAGALPAEFHAHLRAACEARNISDYQLASHVTEEETIQHISRAEELLAAGGRSFGRKGVGQ